MPLEGHHLDQFRPERVPATYFQPLIVGRVYDVPVVFEGRDSEAIDIFSGWWFGRTLGYKAYAAGLDPSKTEVSLRVLGANGLSHVFGPMSVEDIRTKAVPSADARAAVDQSTLRRSLATG
jgi:hypothetical protein